MKQLCFFSDLHLFAQRSRAERCQPIIEEAVQESQIVVLGGDIFDFKWSDRHSAKATAKEGCDWIANLMAVAPQSQFIYLLGNHDCDPAMVEQLAVLSESAPEFSWYHYWMRMDSWLFLHGDVADRRMNQQTLEQKRSKHSNGKRKGKVANASYDLAIQMRLHSLVSKLYFHNDRTCARVLDYLEQIGHGIDSDLTRVYFGHTHRSLHGYPFQGVRFYNCGAPMHGVDFTVLKEAVPGDIDCDKRYGE